MDISKLIAEAMCVAAAVVASATLPMSAAATDMAYGDVAEPSRKDARQQEIKEWFLENYFGRAPVGRLQTVPRFLQNGDGAEMTAKKGVLGAERWEKHFCTLLTVYAVSEVHPL